MASGAERPLKGRVVLVTRPAERGARLGALLARRGARVEQRPTVALVPPSDPAPAADAISRLAGFDWIVFSSSNGVRFFFDALAAAGERGSAPRCRVASIGPATTRELEAHGRRPDVVARASRAEGLADALRARVRPGELVLLVRPEETRPVLARRLRDLGLRVDAVPFYRNVPAPGLAALAADLVAGRYDAAVFTAPSTLRRLLEGAGERLAELREALARMPLVAIGEVTAAAIEEQALPVGAVAGEPTDEGLAAAVRGVFND